MRTNEQILTSLIVWTADAWLALVTVLIAIAAVCK